MSSLFSRARWPCALVAALAVACAAPDAPFNGQPVEEPVELRLAGTNWDGTPFTLADVEGKVTVVFFGYTYCPDVCPFTLAKMKQLKARLGERADELAVVFVSVDPQRDSVEKLSRYVPNFDQSFVGLRLDDEQMAAAKETFGLAVQFGQPKDGPGTDSYYYVDHTGTYFVLDRAGDLRLRFPPSATVDDLAPDVERLLAG